jgi:DNA mismatch endonuclease (patch repair protein)
MLMNLPRGDMMVLAEMNDVSGPREAVVTAARSELMSRVRGRDTLPELRVRKAAHALGYRFRLHRRELPGSPDVVFPKLKVALFVHGCFWHRHEGCRRTTTPKTRADFWQRKFDANRERDARASAQLKALGWRCEIVWECETAQLDQLRQGLQRRLESA